MSITNNRADLVKIYADSLQFLLELDIKDSPKFDRICERLISEIELIQKEHVNRAVDTREDGDGLPISDIAQLIKEDLNTHGISDLQKDRKQLLEQIRQLDNKIDNPKDVWPKSRNTIVTTREETREMITQWLKQHGDPSIEEAYEAFMDDVLKEEERGLENPIDSDDLPMIYSSGGWWTKEKTERYVEERKRREEEKKNREGKK